MMLAHGVKLDVFHHYDLARVRLEDRAINYFIDTLAIAVSQKLECFCCTCRCPYQTFALRVFADGVEQLEKRLFHARQLGCAASRNTPDAALSCFEFTFLRRLPVAHTKD